MSEKGKELAAKLMALRKEGKVAFDTFDGLYVSNLEDLIYKQPADGLLYDLNRDPVTCLSWIEQEAKSWINNYAAGVVIEKLHADVLSTRLDIRRAMEAMKKFTDWYEEREPDTPDPEMSSLAMEYRRLEAKYPAPEDKP